MFSSLNFWKNLNSDYFVIDDVADYISEMFTNLVQTIDNEIQSRSIHDLRSEVKFLFGGWDWKGSKFRLWKLFYSSEVEGFLPQEVTNDDSRNRFYVFMGEARDNQLDIEKRAKDDLTFLLIDEDKIDSRLDLEPLKVLKQIALDPKIDGIGKSLQIAKIYKSGKTEFFGIIWPSSEGYPCFQGRKYNFLNKPPVRYFDSDTFEIVDMDIPEYLSLSNLAQDDFGEDYELIKECFPNGTRKENLTEYQKDRIKNILKKVAYSKFLKEQHSVIPIKEEEFL